MCGMTPREVLPMKAGVSIVLRPASEMRPRRGASTPVVLRSVNSIISGGNWSSLFRDASLAILRMQPFFPTVMRFVVACCPSSWTLNYFWHGGVKHPNPLQPQHHLCAHVNSRQNRDFSISQAYHQIDTSQHHPNLPQASVSFATSVSAATRLAVPRVSSHRLCGHDRCHQSSCINHHT